MSTHDIELPQGYAERPFDYSGDLYIEGQMRSIIKANRALASERDALAAEIERLAEALRMARGYVDSELAAEHNKFAIPDRPVVSSWTELVGLLFGSVLFGVFLGLYLCGEFLQ